MFLLLTGMVQSRMSIVFEGTGNLAMSAVDPLYWEEVERARSTPSEEKLLAGIRLFELSSRLMMDGIRWENPEANEHEVRQLLDERLALIRRLEVRRQ
ncbi:MAG: hypothetical protein JNM56_35180 [Planctomycetia bacterium]|nr:hypothetical protein [Planctomycetia bacterium]